MTYNYVKMRRYYYRLIVIAYILGVITGATFALGFRPIQPTNIEQPPLYAN